MTCKREGDQEEAAAFPNPPSPSRQRRGSSSTSLELGLSFYDCEGASCKPARSRNKTPRHRGRCSELLHVPGNCRIRDSGGGCSDKGTGAGGFWKQSAGRQAARSRIGLSFQPGSSSRSCRKTERRRRPALGSRRPLAWGRGRFGVAVVTPRRV